MVRSLGMRLLFGLFLVVIPALAENVEGPLFCNVRIPPEKICDGIRDCESAQTAPGRPFIVPDEDDHVCASGGLLEKTLELRSENLHYGSVLFSWAWRDGNVPDDRLVGYYFWARSTTDVLRETLPAHATYYTAHRLHGSTKYDVHLRPFYSSHASRLRRRWLWGDIDTRQGTLGKATRLTVWTPATGPRHLAEKTIQLDSRTNPNGSLAVFWTWSDGVQPIELAGYHLRGVSASHNFETNLSNGDTDIDASLLRPYTKYELTLRPFYKLNGVIVDDETLGNPVTLSVRTPAAAPGPPTALVRLPADATSKENGQLALTVLEPAAWNSKPLGFHVRWEPTEEAEQAGRDIAVPVTTTSETNQNHDVNVTLYLKPGRQYTVYASAKGVGEAGEVYVGPEISMTLETTPKAPINFTAIIVDPRKAIFAWTAPGPARFFVVAVTGPTGRRNMYRVSSHMEGVRAARSSFRDNHTEIPCGAQLPGPTGVAEDSADRSRCPSLTITPDGNDLAPSFYRLPLWLLTPSSEHVALVAACAADTCSEYVETKFQTPPSVIPVPVITRVLSNESGSIYLEWYTPFMTQIVTMNPEFHVTVWKNGFLRRIPTVKEELMIRNLTGGTEYEVEIRMSLTVAAARRRYGGPAKAVITTWSYVPLAPTLRTRGFETAPEIAAVSWYFVNSTVTHLEFAINSSPFVNCESSPNCTVNVLRDDRNSSVKGGIVEMSGLSPYETYVVTLRGCNARGCGDATAAGVVTAASEPGAPTDLEVRSTKDGSGVLTWRAPAKAAGPLSGYWASWHCDDSVVMSSKTRNPPLVITGLPIEAHRCEFSVWAYNDLKHSEELHGEAETLEIPWPPSRLLTEAGTGRLEAHNRSAVNSANKSSKICNSTL